MPPIRVPLGACDSNRLLNFELDRYERRKIIGGFILGVLLAAIALGLGYNVNSVWSTIRADEHRVAGFSIARAGRPKEYTNREERTLLRHMRLFPKHTYARVIQEVRLTIKTSTVKKILKRYGITN